MRRKPGKPAIFFIISRRSYDYLLKPLDLQKLDRVLGEALKVARLMREPAVVVGTHPDDGQAGEATVGSCPEARDRLLLPCVLG
jgi:DNA-binding NtrC family response regulator